MIPSIDQCCELMDQYRMLDNIRAHSFMVARVAALIAHGLRKADVFVAIEPVIAGALLHDIAKTPCLHNGENHAIVGRDICLQHGLDELAEIVAEHVVLRGAITELGASAKEIVNYADKRVRHDQVVSLEERKEYLVGHYGRDDLKLCQLIQDNFVTIRLLEQRLFVQLDFGPDDIAGLVADRTRWDALLLPLELFL